jgi:hypothetical protein
MTMKKVILDEKALQEITNLLGTFPINELQKVEKVVEILNKNVEQEATEAEEVG